MMILKKLNFSKTDYYSLSLTVNLSHSAENILEITYGGIYSLQTFPDIPNFSKDFPTFRKFSCLVTPNI